MSRGMVFAPLWALFSLLSAPAAAQMAGAGEGDGDEAAPLVVTANRTAMPADRVGQSVTVLDGAAVEASQAIGITELIAQTPGVQFSRNGGPGTTTSVYLRGAETGQTLVLVDGVRLNDPSTTDSGASLADVMAGNIGRIEILRGAQSTLYGSQAIGGVVNIVTHEPQTAFEADLRAEAGERDSYLLHGGIGGRAGALSWRGGAGYARTDGVSAYAPGSETDGYENLSLHGRIDYALADTVSLDLRSYYTSGEAEFDGFNTDSAEYVDSESLLNHAGLNLVLFGVLHNRLAYARTDISRTNYDRADPAARLTTFEADGSSDRFEYQGTLNLRAGWLAAFGIEHAENELRTAGFGSTLRATDDTTGVYGQVSVAPLAGLTLTGGLRREDHSTFGASTVASASVAYTPDSGNTVLRASWGEGFKAPSLYQLYSEYGNSALAPEEADSWDAGIERRVLGRVTLAATYFERRSSDLVDFVSCFADPANPLCADGRFGFYANVGRVKANGVELAGSLDLGAFSASANYTLLDTRNAGPGGSNEGNRLARRPKDTFNAMASYAWPFGLVTAATLKIVGNSFNDGGNTQLIDGYTLVDVRMSYPLTERIEIYARAENLFDEDYETVTDYGTLPRTVYAGLRLKL